MRKTKEQKAAELQEAKDSYVGTIYKWGSWEQGWHGRNVVVDIDEKYVYFKSVYKTRDEIVFIKDKVKVLESGWFIDKGMSSKITHKEFERRLKKTYTFVEVVSDFNK